MIRVEFRKQLWRVRTYLALGLMVAIPLIIAVAFKLGGGPHERGEVNLFSLATRSGLNMPLAALLSVNSFLLPVVVSLFAGGAVAEEASWGTLRYLLLRPVSRRRLLATKLAVVAVFAIIATVLVAATGLAGGIAAFGWHPVVVPSVTAALTPTSLTTLAQGEALSRLVVATFCVAWSMAAVVAFAFMLSTMTDAALGAVSGGIGLTIVSEILDAIPPLKTLRNFLPTHYWQAWNGLFQHPVATGEMIRGALLQVPYAVAFLVVAWWWFHRKDIVS